MVEPKRFKVNNVSYRKGFIEVIPNIHDGCINLETWNIRPDFDISNYDLNNPDTPDEVITGNTELELNVTEAIELIDRLQKAIDQLE